MTHTSRIPTTAPALTPAADARVMKRLLSVSVTLVAVAAAVVLLAPTLLGMQRYVITGGSMEPTIHKGSLVFSDVVPTSSLRVGDVVTYRPPAGSPETGLVTHRIVWSGRDKNGALGFKTRGDANTSDDPWRFGLGSSQARVRWTIPYAGYALAYASRPQVRFVLIGIPALLVAFFVLSGLWREAGADARRLTQPAA